MKRTAKKLAAAVLAAAITLTGLAPAAVYAAPEAVREVSERDALKQRIAELKKRMALLESDAEASYDKIEEIMKRRNETEEMKVYLEAVEKATSAHDALVEFQTETGYDSQTYQEVVQAYEDRMPDLQAAIDLLNEELETVKNAGSEYLDEIEQYESRIYEDELQLASYQDMVNSLGIQLEEAEENGDLEEAERLRKEIDAKSAHIPVLQARLKGERAHLEELYDAVSAASEGLRPMGEIQSELDVYLDEKDSLERPKKEMEKLAALYKEECEALEKAYNDAHQEQMDARNAYLEAYADLEMEYEDAIHEYFDIRNEIFLVREDLKEAEQALEKLVEQSESVTDIFKDVPEDAWYTEAVQYVYDKEIMTGMNETVFGPANILGRAQFAMILYRLADSPEVTYSPKFKDIKDGQWYTGAVLWAAENGIVTGYTNGANAGKFGPGNAITREQMATILYRFAAYEGYDTTGVADFASFPDAKSVSSFARDAMKWAVGNGIITGKEKNGKRYLTPQGQASRAECAVIIMRFMEAYMCK